MWKIKKDTFDQKEETTIKKWAKSILPHFSFETLILKIWSVICLKMTFICTLFNFWTGNNTYSIQNLPLENIVCHPYMCVCVWESVLCVFGIWLLDLYNANFGVLLRWDFPPFHIDTSFAHSSTPLNSSHESVKINCVLRRQKEGREKSVNEKSDEIRKILKHSGFS